MTLLVRLRKIICLLFSVTVCLLCLQEVNATEQDKIVKIGVLLPLSGEMARYGVDIQRGIELAVEKLKKEKSPIELKFQYEDDQHQIRNAISAAKKLLEIDKVDILVALWDMADPVAPIAERQKIPLFSIRWNPHLTETNKYAITLETTYLSYAKSQIEQLKALNVKKVAHIVEVSQGWGLVADALREFAPKAGIQIIAEESYLPGDSDFSSIVTKTLSKKPDVVIITGFQPAIGLILRKIKEQNPSQFIIGYFEIVDPAQVEGMPFVAQYEARPWFKEMFRERYGEDFTSRAAHGYDLVHMTNFVYKSAGKKVSSEEFLAAISKLKDFPGATGRLSSNSTRNIENVPVWQIAKDGKFVPLTEKDIELLKIKE